MEPRIEIIEDRKLIGIRIRTTISENPSRELWQKFKPRVHEIGGRSSTDFYSVQVFEDDARWGNLTPFTAFDKWAAVAVGDLASVPIGMEALSLAGGSYAVFILKGTPAAYPQLAEYIYGEWIPRSEYEVNGGTHFEIMSANYRPDDPNAVEEVWVPIRLRSGEQR